MQAEFMGVWVWLWTQGSISKPTISAECLNNTLLTTLKWQKCETCSPAKVRKVTCFKYTVQTKHACMHVTQEKCNRSAFRPCLGKLFCLSCISLDVSQHCSSGTLPSKEILVVLGLCLVSETPTGLLGLKIQDQVGNHCALLVGHSKSKYPST